MAKWDCAGFEVERVLSGPGPEYKYEAYVIRFVPAFLLFRKKQRTYIGSFDSKSEAEKAIRYIVEYPKNEDTYTYNCNGWERYGQW